MKTDTFSQKNSDEAYNWLVGRKVVEVSMEGIGIPGTERTRTYWDGDVPHIYYREYADGYLVLDDGTKAYIRGNEGCGGCSNGYYNLKHLATVDNVITSVRLATETSCYDEYSDEDVSYRIFVYAGAEEINLMQVDGTDGNGYYGTGYEITVVFPDE